MLYRLKDGKLALVGQSDLSNSAELTSEVLPLRFRLIAGASRPLIEVTTLDKSQRWEV